MNTTLPIKVIDLAQWKDTMDISNPDYHYVITGTNRNCGCINFLNEDASGEKVYYVTLRNCVWEAQLWHSALGFIVRNGHGTLRAHLEVEGESTLIGSNFPGIDVNGAQVILDAAGKGAKLNLNSDKNPEGLRIINGGKVELGTGTLAVEMAVGGETFTDFNAFLAAASQRKPVTLGLDALKRVTVLVNKAFEYEGFRDGVMQVLGVSEISKYEFKNLAISEFCIENAVKWEGKSTSNSEQKYKGLVNDVFNVGPKPECIFSVSTCESTYEAQGGETDDGKPERSANGCVFVGGRYFMADCREINIGGEASSLPIGRLGPEDDTRYYPLQVGVAELLAQLNDPTLVKTIGESLHAVPNFSAKPLVYASGAEKCCVGVVNVTNYKQYPIADGFAYGLFYKEAAKKKSEGEEIGTPIGIETTHGVVRMAAEAKYGANVPVIFVSPITDRFVRFDKDVTSTVGKTGFESQNYASSYNSGVALAHMMKFLDEKNA